MGGMGGEVLSAFLQAVFQTAFTLLLAEVKLVRGLEEETKKLVDNVCIIKAVLSKAEEMEDKENSLDLWLKKLTDFAYKVVDKLEVLDYEDQRHKLVSMAQVRQALSSVNPKRMVFRHKMSHEIQSLVRELREFMQTAESLHSRVLDRGRQKIEGDELSVSTSLLPPSVYGRESDKRAILEMLLRVNTISGSSVPAIAIHGECGIGKTALAQIVYNDEDVKSRFDLRSWVDVSHDFNIKRLTSAVIESIDSAAPNHIVNMDSLQTQLQRKLSGRRFLLVLDNVWNEKPEEWSKFCLPLLCGAEGSKILLTTRSMAVVTTVGSESTYKLKPLSDDECWSLFCEHAVGRNLYRHSDMADTAKEILNRCRGLPMLATSIGNQLSKEKDKRMWISNLRSNKQGISGYDYDFRRSIRLSYQQLPAHIKPCFAYCAILPRGFEFEKELMLHFWMALNLIEPLAEDSGSNLFDFLVGRSLFERSAYDDRRGRHRYQMTQVAHDLAQLVSGDECSILRIGTPCGEKARHVSLICNQFESNGQMPSKSAAQTNIFGKIFQCVGLHSLILLGGSRAYDLKVPDKLAAQLSRLRILDLSNCGLKLLPESLGDLKHLRCLQLRDTNISRLPDSLGRLYNLQTLGLRNCYLLEELPSDTKNLRKLRHLDLHLDQDPSLFVSRLRSMPPEIGLLTNLVILTRFVIGTDAGCGLGELKELNRLQGNLIISNLHLVRNAVEAKEANLTSKVHIRNLQLQWASTSTRQVRNDKSILSNLKPPENLEKLSLVGYTDPSFPSWLSDSTFNNLEVLRLAKCNDCESLPRLGCLPMLHELEIKNLDKVKVVDCKFFCNRDGTFPNFPNLEKLVFEDMRSFEAWDGDDGCSLPSLSHLEIKDCTVLRQLAHDLPSLSVLKVEGCPSLIGLPRFPRLETLGVARSGEWIFSSLPCLSGLTDLSIQQCEQLKFLPDLMDLTSLVNLEISHCPQLLHLPRNGLPVKLKFLTINNCPLLKEACQNGEGQDWLKLANVISMRIDKQLVIPKNQLATIC